MVPFLSRRPPGGPPLQLAVSVAVSVRVPIPLVGAFPLPPEERSLTLRFRPLCVQCGCFHASAEVWGELKMELVRGCMVRVSLRQASGVSYVRSRTCSKVFPPVVTGVLF